MILQTMVIDNKQNKIIHITLELDKYYSGNYNHASFIASKSIRRLVITGIIVMRNEYLLE